MVTPLLGEGNLRAGCSPRRWGRSGSWDSLPPARLFLQRPAGPLGSGPLSSGVLGDSEEVSRPRKAGGTRGPHIQGEGFAGRECSA